MTWLFKKNMQNYFTGLVKPYVENFECLFDSLLSETYIINLFINIKQTSVLIFPINIAPSGP